MTDVIAAAPVATGLMATGQRVIWSVTLPCGTCDRCLTGVTTKCRTVRKAGHEAGDSDWPLSGGYDQHVLLPHGMPIAIVDDAVGTLLIAPPGTKPRYSIAAR